MRQPPVIVSPSAFLTSLMYYMFKENIGAVIVEEKGRILGMITERDILERAVLRGKDLYKTKASEIMSTPLLSIEADRPIKQALELMRKNNVRRLAVTENGALVGIVTERRLFLGVLSEHI